MATTINARQALTPEGWREDVAIKIDDEGRIASISGAEPIAAYDAGVLLPAISNLHSHSFQRAMAGLAESRGSDAGDNFWTWRKVMYRFLEELTPDDIESIAAFAQMEMLEAGFAAQAEFHYLHHSPNGATYSAIEETSLRHFNAAKLTGIGYTHLPVLYMQGGLDGRALEGGQRRFGNSIDQFGKLFTAIKRHLPALPSDIGIGVAPHSLRAVSKEGIEAAISLAPEGPVHIHVAEQIEEVKEVSAKLGAPPVQWLLSNMPVDARWCLVHATHLDRNESDDLAQSGAIAGLCPTTEANLGDGVFGALRFMEAGGKFGVGTDSNTRISVVEELRLLEVSQRLTSKQRVILADDETPSNGRFLCMNAAAGGATALQRDTGQLREGAWADIVALNDRHHDIIGLKGDKILDAWIFAGSEDAIDAVWAAGRKMVVDGKHIHHDKILERYKKTAARLRRLV